MKNRFSPKTRNTAVLRRWVVIAVALSVILYSFTGVILYASGLMDGILSSLDTSNHTHALDKDYNTSANIFSQDGYIIYRMDTAQLFPGWFALLTLNGSDNLAHTVRIESLDVNLDVVADSESFFDIDGHKDTCRYSIPADAMYLKIYGIPAAALYLYELEHYMPAPPGDIAVHANNLDHARDGDLSTSANIFREDGSILYLLDTLPLVPGNELLINMNGADGGAHEVTITAYSFDLYFESEFTMEESAVIAIDGFKNSYRYTVPPWAAFLKISGLPTTHLYIYEMMQFMPAPPGDIAVHANNLDHARDGDLSTSANIFREDGSILYLLNTLPLVPGNKLLINMNGADGGAHEVTITAYSFDLYFESEFTMEESAVIAIDGFKNSYQYTVPPWAAFLKISGLPTTHLYIYEIEQDMTPPGPPRAANANNLDHAYDRSELTSANIFDSNGHILYSLDDLGLYAGSTAWLMMNGADGMLHPVTVKALDGTFQEIPGSEQTLWADGFKPVLGYPLPADAAYLWIQGIDSTALYIYEIYPALDGELSDVSAADNTDGTFTMSLFLRDGMGQGVAGQTLSDIEVFISGVGTWSTLQALHNGPYWNIALDDGGDGSYEILVTRTGSLPYSRNWIVRVDQIEIGTVAVSITIV